MHGHLLGTYSIAQPSLAYKLIIFLSFFQLVQKGQCQMTSWAMTSQVRWLLLPLAFHMVGRGERLGIIVYEHASHDLIHPSNLTQLNPVRVCCFVALFVWCQFISNDFNYTLGFLNFTHVAAKVHVILRRYAMLTWCMIVKNKCCM
jgi:hypothetical protein